MDKDKKITICVANGNDTYFFNGKLKFIETTLGELFWVLMDEKYADLVYINSKNIIWWKYKKELGDDKSG